MGGSGPRIYVACLAAYNQGDLHGAWIDADQDEDAIHEEIRAMLAASPVGDAESYAIHDYDGFYGVRLDEYEPISKVREIAEFLGEVDKPELAKLLLQVDDDLETARDRLKNHYIGGYSSLRDFGESQIDFSEVPQYLHGYIDSEKFARDMRLGGEILVVESGGVHHVFWNH